MCVFNAVNDWSPEPELAGLEPGPTGMFWGAASNRVCFPRPCQVPYVMKLGDFSSVWMQIIPSCWSCPVPTPGRKVIGAPRRVLPPPGALHPLGAGVVLVGVKTFFLRCGPPLWVYHGRWQVSLSVTCFSLGLQPLSWYGDLHLVRGAHILTCFPLSGGSSPRSSQLVDGDDVSSEQKVLVRFRGRGRGAGDGPLSSRAGLGEKHHPALCPLPQVKGTVDGQGEFLT